jgi:hypothetical protein
LTKPCANPVTARKRPSGAQTSRTDVLKAGFAFKALEPSRARAVPAIDVGRRFELLGRSRAVTYSGQRQALLLCGP